MNETPVKPVVTVVNLHKMRLYDRNMICECGNNLDLDKNSSINIMFTFPITKWLVDSLSTIC